MELLPPLSTRMYWKRAETEIWWYHLLFINFYRNLFTIFNQNNTRLEGPNTYGQTQSGKWGKREWRRIKWKTYRKYWWKRTTLGKWADKKSISAGRPACLVCVTVVFRLNQMQTQLSTSSKRLLFLRGHLFPSKPTRTSTVCMWAKHERRNVDIGWRCSVVFCVINITRILSKKHLTAKIIFHLTSV